MKQDIHTLSRLLKGRIESLKSIPAKAKDAYATAEQVRQFNELRQHVVDSVESQTELIPPPLAAPQLASRSGRGNDTKYADVLTKYSDLLVVAEANEQPLGPSTG